MPNIYCDRLTSPTFSIICPTYNRAEGGYLRNAIESVINQTSIDWELIIIDDASIDGSFDIIKEYMERDPRISCIRHKENIGLPVLSSYEGLMRSSGEYIALLFDDNTWYENALSDTYDFIIKNNAKATYGIIKLHGQNGECIEIGKKHGELLPHDILWATNQIPNGAVVIHREVFDTVGWYDPHLSLTRICDWDLWRRIYSHYRWFSTNIVFGDEYGPLLSNSLGNSLPLDHWALYEHRAYRRDEKLVPINFLEYDIIDSAESMSSLYLSHMKERADYYRGKFWFDSDRMDLSKITVNKNHRRIVLIVNDVDATLLFFTRNKNKDVTIIYQHVNFLSMPLLLVYAHAVIACRCIHQISEKFLNMLKQSNIPIYAFYDDNFKEIAKVEPFCFKNDYCLAAKYITRKNLKQYNGIILSSSALLEYFRFYHQNLILVAPVFDEELMESINPTKHFLSIAFLGGTYRMNSLFNTVLPAIKKLSETFPIYFYCRNDNKKELNKFKTDRLIIKTFQVSTNLDLILRECGNTGVHILVHCGTEDTNSKYKTKNALLNATTIGAVLVASNIPPYSNPNEEERKAYLLAEDNIESWYQNLLLLVEDEKAREDTFENALQYCRKHFDHDKVWKNLRDEILHYPSEITPCNVLNRVRLFFLNTPPNSLDYLSTLINKNDINCFSSDYNYKPINPNELVYSGDIYTTKKYSFVSNIESINEINLLFGKRGKCEGYIYINLYKNNLNLASIKIDINSISEVGYTNFKIDRINNCLNMRFMIAIFVDYKEKMGDVGLFEIKNKRSFLYRFCNKIKLPIAGRDVLFLDFKDIGDDEDD